MNMTAKKNLLPETFSKFHAELEMIKTKSRALYLQYIVINKN